MDNFERLVREERKHQDRKWSEQNHNPIVWLAILGEEYGELQKSVLEDSRNTNPNISHKIDIEVELIQIAAVAKVMYESGKRNNWL